MEKSKLIIGNEIEPGIWQGDVPAEMMAEVGHTAIFICTHDRKNDHGDACLDCGAVFIDGMWQ